MGDSSGDSNGGAGWWCAAGEGKEGDEEVARVVDEEVVDRQPGKERKETRSWQVWVLLDLDMVYVGGGC